MTRHLFSGMRSVGWIVALVLGGSTVHAAEVTCSGYPEVMRDNQVFRIGEYTSFLAAWGKGELVQGRDYSECLGVHRSTYPNNQKIEWSWPDYKPKKGGVYNFLAVDYGNYDVAGYKSSVEPKKIRDIKALSQTFDLDIKGDLQGFDVIEDFFLTSEPSNTDKKLFEVEIFLHTPQSAVNYASSVKQLGSFTASGITWIVSIDDHAAQRDILLRPENNQQILKAKLDIKEILDNLMAANVLKGDEYFNGLGLGVEVGQGSGSILFNRLSTTYK